MDKKLKQVVHLIIEDINPKQIILFGSRAKEKNSHSSDYDVAVDAKKIRFRDKRKLIDRIEAIIGLHSIDLIFFNDVDADFKEIILRTGKVIYER
ncbi:MAG: nucleotidyltransferase domain-containing protein [Ignavibacteriaceae bacterium]|nr:nucleotidyltransferase domain-containing protein [Ignavibacteriaceae bacterium]